METALIQQVYNVNEKIKSYIRGIRNAGTWGTTFAVSQEEFDALVEKAEALLAKARKRFAKQIAESEVKVAILREAFAKVGMAEAEIEPHVEMFEYWTKTYSILPELEQQIVDLKEIFPKHTEVVIANKRERMTAYKAQIEQLEAELEALNA